MMRLAIGIGLVVLLTACGLNEPGVSSGASCALAGPPLSDRPADRFTGGTTTLPTFAPGDAITIYGRGYVDDCYDTGKSGEPPPASRVVLMLELPGGVRSNVGVIKPDEHGEFSTTLRVPLAAQHGTASITDDFGYDRPFIFNIAQRSQN